MSFGFGGLVGLLILVLDILVIIKVLQSGRSTEYKLIWILVILLLPLVGLLLWFLLSERKF